VPCVCQKTKGDDLAPVHLCNKEDDGLDGGADFGIPLLSENDRML
jgi:hypothetical protein